VLRRPQAMVFSGRAALVGALQLALLQAELQPAAAQSWWPRQLLGNGSAAAANTTAAEINQRCVSYSLRTGNEERGLCLSRAANLSGCDAAHPEPLGSRWPYFVLVVLFGTMMKTAEDLYVGVVLVVLAVLALVLLLVLLLLVMVLLLPPPLLLTPPLQAPALPEGHVHHHGVPLRHHAGYHKDPCCELLTRLDSSSRSLLLILKYIPLQQAGSRTRSCSGRRWRPAPWPGAPPTHTGYCACRRCCC